MSIPYDLFTDAFLNKVTEFELVQLSDETREAIVDGYMKKAVSAFHSCKYELAKAYDDATRSFAIDIPKDEVFEIIDIISEGMLIHWLKPYVYKQELLENVLNTRDFSVYSPAELLLRVGNAYSKVQKDYTQMVREYSFNHGDLASLHI